MLRAQKASQPSPSLLNNARRWQTASPPSSPQRMPPLFIRWPTTVWHALSTGPLPIGQPLASYDG